MELLEIIGEQQLSNIETRTPQALLAVADAIDKINAKPISLKGLSDSIVEVQKLSGQLVNIYAETTEQQQKAALGLQRLAKANKDNADAALKTAKAEEIKRKSTEASTKATESNTKATQSNMEYAKSHTLEVKNEAEIIAANTAATNANTGARRKSDEEVRASIAAWDARRAAERAATTATVENTVSQEANNVAINESIGSEGGKGIKGATSGLRTFWGGLRQIAYILPGLGIAGIFNIAFESIVKVADALTGAKRELKEYQKALENAALSTQQEALHEINTMKELIGIAKDSKIAMNQRLDAIKLLRQNFPEYFNDLTNEKILYGNITESVNNATVAILQNAKAKGFANQANLAADEYAKAYIELDKLTKKVAEYYVKNQKAIDAQQKAAANPSFANSEIGASSTPELDVFNSLQKQMEIARNKAISFQSDIIKFQQLAIQNTKDTTQAFGDVATVQTKAQKDLVNEIVAAQKRLTDAERDAEVERLNQVISNNQDIINDEKRSIDDRAGAYAEMFAARLKIAALNRDKELSDIEEWEKQYQSEIEKAQKTEVSSQTEHQKALLIDYEAYQVRRLAINNTYNKAVQDATNTANENTRKIAKETAEFLSGDGIFNKDFIKEVKQSNDDLYDYLKKKRKDDLKDEKDAAKEREAYLRASIELLSSIGSVLDGQTNTYLKSLDVRSQKLKDNLESEIAAINASADTEEQKQERIRTAQSQTAILQQKIDDDERRARIRQAVLDKAITISTIILNTALAVSKLLATPPLAIAAGIAGAAQLAIAVATPIPQYMHGIYGDESHPGGKMIVGDGGERELMISPSGALEWSPSTATLMTRPKGTQVIPEHILMQSILNGQSSIDSGSEAKPNDLMILKKEIANLGGIIKNKKEVHINIDRYGLTVLERKANARTKYLGRIYNNK